MRLADTSAAAFNPLRNFFDGFGAAPAVYASPELTTYGYVETDISVYLVRKRVVLAPKCVDAARHARSPPLLRMVV